MKCITEAEFNELIAGCAERDERARAMANVDLHELARTVIDEAARRGMVLTIEQRSVPPFAMGHYETVVSVRPARMAAHITEPAGVAA